MRIMLRHATLAGASSTFLALAAAAFVPSAAQAGPLAVTPKHDVAPAVLTEHVQFRGRVGVRHGGVRYAGARYWRGGRYYHGNYGAAFFPGVALGLFAGALGAATYGASPYYCDPYYYTWNYCGGYPAYSGAYYPAYYGGYYPAYWGGGYYPVYRNRVVRYRVVHRPRVVNYRVVAPRRHLIGTRTYVRAGYGVRRR